MTFFSIKWKISICFVILCLVFVAAYAFLATRVFESDKLSYVFETQQRQVESLAQNFSNVVERGLLSSRAVVLGFDSASRRALPASQKFFMDDPALMAIELIREGDSKPLFLLEKVKGQLAEIRDKVGDREKVKENQPRVELTHWRENLYVLTIIDFNEDQDLFRTRVLFKIEDLLDEALDTQTLAVFDKNHVAQIPSSSKISLGDLQKYLEEVKYETPDGTSIIEILGQRQLISVAATPFSGFKILAILSEDSAMSALKTLYQRSIIFLLFSLFATIFIALILSLGLTRGINRLTTAAERLGSGDFSVMPENDSRDEVGVLTKAFQRMIFEIQRLLRDTADKARMEAELKTARLVQESLFPEKRDATINNLSLSGFYATSSECGGDWWYYYVRGDDVFIAVADATGHGTPAALVTSAARSMFSYMERTDLTLKEIAGHWNEAIAVCSKQRVFMTALLARINTVTGVGTYINAGHEPPVLLVQSDGKFAADFLIGAKNATLGERDNQQWSEGHFHVLPGSRLLIFTDGLTSFKSPDGKSVGEKRFIKTLEKLSVENVATRPYVEKIFKHFDDFGGNQTLPDDVTFVVIDNIAKS